MIMKKLYLLGSRNILIEGGNDLTNHLLKKKFFNQFYLFQSLKKLPKLNDYIEFNGLKTLKQSYKKKIKLEANFGKDTVILYKN
jgi:diaminohydroxyphosphoribosylaminopyrimidine deaminase/5-amino-6-(5-phosphoribosylamino)uracil reductase